MLENVQAALTLPAGLVREGKVDRRWLERFRRQVPEKVRRAVEPFGYYRAEVQTDLESEDGNYRLVVRVDPGQPVRITSVHVALQGPGADRSALKELIAKFPLRQNDVLRQDQYEHAKGAIKARALDLGYLKAAFSRHEIRINRETGTAEIDLALDTGPRYYFGEATIEGGEEYPPAFLRRYLAFHVGEVFSYAKLGKTQLNFLDSDRFRQVIVTPQEELAENGKIPIAIHLEPSLPKRLRPGVGYATDTGARFSLRYKDVNAFHLGHELRGEFLVAQLAQSLGTSYIIPSRENVDSLTAFRLTFNRQNPDTYDSRSLAAEVEQVRSFGRGMIGSVYLSFLREQYKVGEENSTTSLLVLPGARFSRRRYNNNIRPEKGYFYRLEARGTHQALGSDLGMLQILASGNTVVPLPVRLSLLLRLDTGFTLQNEPFADIPPTLRFFAGGDQSVRGYAYKSLGPEDQNGDVIGGKNLLVGSIEMVRALWAHWGVAVFYDAGNAFNDLGNFVLRQGAGVGVRWYTPVGPIKVDLARQMGVSDPAYRLHVSIGFGW